MPTQADKFLETMTTLINMELVDGFGDEDLLHNAEMCGMVGKQMELNHVIVQFADKSRASWTWNPNGVQFADKSRASWTWNPNGSLAEVRALKPNRIFIATVQVAVIAEDEAEATDNLTRHLFAAEATGKVLDFRYTGSKPMPTKDLPTDYVEGSIWSDGAVFYQACFEFDGSAQPFGPRFPDAAEAMKYGRDHHAEHTQEPDTGETLRYISVCAYQDHDEIAEYLREVANLGKL